MCDKVIKSEQQWREVLTPEQFRIARSKRTEEPFTGEYWDFKADGIFECTCCGNALFDSEAKFDSRTGWPSFREPILGENIREVEDRSFFAKRTQVVCNKDL